MEIQFKLVRAFHLEWINTQYPFNVYEIRCRTGHRMDMGVNNFYGVSSKCVGFISILDQIGVIGKSFLTLLNKSERTLNISKL